MAVKVFIWAVFALGLLLCVLAALFGVGEGGAILYRVGAVITILTGVIALAGTAVTDHLNGTTMAKHSTIPGVERATFLIDGLHDFQERQGETDIALLTVAIEAQVQATLALVEQQRLASLIVWEAVTGEKNRAIIRHGLGLWEPDPKDVC